MYHFQRVGGDAGFDLFVHCPGRLFILTATGIPSHSHLQRVHTDSPSCLSVFSQALTLQQ